MPINLAQSSASSQNSAQDHVTLRQVFSEITAESCPGSFNFHLHTVHSDGKLQPEALMEQAIAIGLKGLAITDHHSVKGYHVAQQWLTTWQSTTDAPAPTLWTGIEINADLLDIEVHILGYAFDPEHSAIQPYFHKSTADQVRPAEQVIAAIHRAGGLAVLAHPARYRVPHHHLIPAAAQLGIDAVETYYAYNNPSPWAPSPQQTQDIYQLATHHQLLHTCGTDTHGLSLLRRL